MRLQALTTGKGRFRAECRNFIDAPDRADITRRMPRQELATVRDFWRQASRYTECGSVFWRRDAIAFCNASIYRGQLTGDTTLEIEARHALAFLQGVEQ